jgi:hypothetical protein
MAVTMHEPSVAVVVLNYRGAALTVACVESALASVGAQPLVIVVDNASGDGSAARLTERFGGDERVAIVEAATNGGYTAGNNIGVALARAAGARYALILNNDTVLDAHCARHLVDAMERDRHVALANPRIFFGEPADALWFGGGTYSPWTGRPRHVGFRRAAAHGWTATHELPVATGCALLVRLDAVRGALFDESLFTYAEDLDVSLRLRAAGHRLLYVPEATVWHFEGSAHRGGSGQALRAYLNTRNLLRVNARHARWYHWPVLGPALAVNIVGRYAAVALRDGSVASARAALTGAWHAVVGGKHAIERAAMVVSNVASVPNVANVANVATGSLTRAVSPSETTPHTGR